MRNVVLFNLLKVIFFTEIRNKTFAIAQYSELVYKVRKVKQKNILPRIQISLKRGGLEWIL